MQKALSALSRIVMLTGSFALVGTLFVLPHLKIQKVLANDCPVGAWCGTFSDTGPYIQTDVCTGCTCAQLAGLNDYYCAFGE